MRICAGYLCAVLMLGTHTVSKPMFEGAALLCGFFWMTNHWDHKNKELVKKLDLLGKELTTVISEKNEEAINRISAEIQRLEASNFSRDSKVDQKLSELKEEAKAAKESLAQMRQDIADEFLRQRQHTEASYSSLRQGMAKLETSMQTGQAQLVTNVTRILTEHTEGQEENTRKQLSTHQEKTENFINNKFEDMKSSLIIITTENKNNFERIAQESSDNVNNRIEEVFGKIDSLETSLQGIETKLLEAANQQSADLTQKWQEEGNILKATIESLKTKLTEDVNTYIVCIESLEKKYIKELASVKSELQVVQEGQKAAASEMTEVKSQLHCMQESFLEKKESDNDLRSQLRDLKEYVGTLQPLFIKQKEEINSLREALFSAIHAQEQQNTQILKLLQRSVDLGEAAEKKQEAILDFTHQVSSQSSQPMYLQQDFDQQDRRSRNKLPFLPAIAKSTAWPQTRESDNKDLEDILLQMGHGQDSHLNSGFAGASSLQSAPHNPTAMRITRGNGE